MININGEQYELITDAIFSQTTVQAENNFINQSNDKLNDSIWNKDVSEVEYRIRASNAQKWILDQRENNPSFSFIIDPTYGKTITAMISNMVAKYSFNNFDYPWEITITFDIISINDGTYVGFEKIDDENLFEDGFERIYL